jgi:hypothetical protein
MDEGVMPPGCDHEVAEDLQAHKLRERGQGLDAFTSVMANL